MSKQGARDGRSFREHGIIGSPNMIEAIAKYKDKVIEKLREQKNLIKIARKEAVQKKKKKKKRQQKKKVKPQMKAEIIKEPRGPHDLGLVRRLKEQEIIIIDKKLKEGSYKEEAKEEE